MAIMHARSINLGLYSNLTGSADELLRLANIALDRRELTEDFEQGHGSAPRYPMSAATFYGVGSILSDVALDVADSSEYRAALNQSESESRRIGAQQTAKRRQYASMAKFERETGKCSRCGGHGVLHGYRQDGGVCYRCNGSGRAA